ncbi:MAG: betaine/proline/choline family ABC transporter ATP-binding protein [Firmicutes bacterium]|nr:betaine/proline/choline family ABC transporter ATP-binding protein [Bacillota bacterium]
MTTSDNNGRIAIEVEELWKVFSNGDSGEQGEGSEEEIVAVQDVSLQVKDGEVFVVMGLSGSGKSTLIRCLLRLIEPTSGRIWINNEEVTGLNREELTQFRRERAAMVFQHYGLLPHRNVLDNISFGLKLQGVGREERTRRSLEMVERVGLSGFESYFPAQLSGGMQQRVGIARALANDPPILLMDEPFSGLDPLIRREMQDELLALQEQVNKTIFFVTHDLDEAMRLGDRMAVMKDGGVVQMGTYEEVVENPANEYVAKFVENGR